jgi:DNA-binding CsgD family transcriptional regulator
MYSLTHGFENPCHKKMAALSPLDQPISQNLQKISKMSSFMNSLIWQSTMSRFPRLSVMRHDPASTSEDFRQDYAVILHTRGQRVAQSTYIKRRKIDAARRYTRYCAVTQRFTPQADQDSLSRLILKERVQIIQGALRRATPAQRQVASLFLDGLKRCDIAKRLGISPSAVTHTLQRLRPLFCEQGSHTCNI